MGSSSIMPSALTTPDVLVLGGGGILGEAWMRALLAGLDEHPAFDARSCRTYIGTSAGSIVAAALVAGIDPRSELGDVGGPAEPLADAAPLDLDEDARQDDGSGLTSAAAGTLAALALSTTARGGAVMRRAALSRVPIGRRSLSPLGRNLERAGARWDGRLRVATVDLRGGSRVMFGAPSAPQASVGAAVEASCSIPGVFRPVSIDGRDYVDGGVWSPTNLDTADVERGDVVLCLNPSGGWRPRPTDPTTAVGPVSRMIARAEALTLERRGAQVEIVVPDASALQVMGTNLMDPGPRAAVLRAGFEQGRRIAQARQPRAAA